MRLNKEATIELTASVWLVIFQERIDKIEALELLGFLPSDNNQTRDFIYNCPCCEYVYTQGISPISYSSIRDCEHICPLDDLWPNGCEYKTSPFKMWLRFSGSTVDESLHAMKIAKFAGILAGTWSPELWRNYHELSQ